MTRISNDAHMPFFCCYCSKGAETKDELHEHYKTCEKMFKPAVLKPKDLLLKRLMDTIKRKVINDA